MSTAVTQMEGKVAELRREWNAPKLHVNTVPKVDGPWGEALQKLRDRTARDGRGSILALIGERGNGKTQLAVELMRLATFELRTAFYETAMGFFLRLKETYKRDNALTERGVISGFRRPSLLILDEVGKRSDTDWENRLLFHVVDCRYFDEKDTILISNQPEDEFVRSIGASLASRMKETGGILECDWPEFR